MSEKILRRHVVGALKKAKLDPHSIEDAVSVGVPDVEYIGGWIELKVAPGWPKQARTRLAVDHFTPEQRVWLHRRCYYGGRAFLLLRVGGREFLLFRGDVAAKYLGHAPREILVAKALAHWPDGLINEEFIRCVTESVPPISLRASGS